MKIVQAMNLILIIHRAGKKAKLPVHRLKMRSILLILPFFLLYCSTEEHSYSIVQQSSATRSLLIGLHPVNDSVVWASGTDATIIRTMDGGNNWDVYSHEEDSLQFRDIHGLDNDNALVLSIGTGILSRIYHFNVDSGFTLLYQNTHPDVFLNSFAFWDHRQGIVFGDQVDSLPYLLKTADGGNSWQRITSGLPAAGNGEGGFASSGSQVQTEADGRMWIGTGAGGNGRILYTENFGQSWAAIATPIKKGPMAGITSLQHVNGTLYIAGGDISNLPDTADRFFYSKDSGATWQTAGSLQVNKAYYSCAATYWNGKYVVMLSGPGGAEISLDKASSWQLLLEEDLWTCAFAENYGWIMGRNGKIYRIELILKTN